MSRPRALLSWSSGKDSAWALHRLRREGQVEVVGLVTTFDAATDAVCMHGVPGALVEAQARTAGLPLWPVELPWPCPNAVYEERLRRLVQRARSEGIGHIVFGDLFLEDIRDYRVGQLAGTGVEPLFPLWTSPGQTPELAREMVAGGLEAVLVCVDGRQLDARFAGRAFDAALLAELPGGVDPCGERGEFHTFCLAGPMFAGRVPVEVGEVSARDGFHVVALAPGR